MSAQTWETTDRVRRTPEQGVLVAGPWPLDEPGSSTSPSAAGRRRGGLRGEGGVGMEDVVVLDRAQLWAGRPRPVRHRAAQSRVARARVDRARAVRGEVALDVAVLAVIATMVLGVVLAVAQLARVSEGAVVPGADGAPAVTLARGGEQSSPQG